MNIHFQYRDFFSVSNSGLFIFEEKPSATPPPAAEVLGSSVKKKEEPGVDEAARADALVGSALKKLPKDPEHVKHAERVTRKLNKWAKKERDHAAQTGISPADKKAALDRAHLYEDGAKEKIKPSRGEFFAYAKHLWDMFNRYLNEKGSRNEKNESEWKRQMTKYVSDKFGNGAQLKIALDDLRIDFIKSGFDNADGDFTRKFIAANYAKDSDINNSFYQILVGDKWEDRMMTPFSIRPVPPEKQIYEDIYLFWAATNDFNKQKAESGKSDDK